MPFLKRAGKPALHYRVDDFTDPWKNAPTILLQHGFGRSSQFWYSWVPYLARWFKVVRPDARGLGQSPASFDITREFTVENCVNDLAAIIDHLGAESVHYCGESMGGILGMVLAATQPKRVRTLTLVGTPPPKWDRMGATAAHTTEELEKSGVEAWARKNMGRRLGSRFPAEGAEFWGKMMGRTAASTMIGFSASIPYVDIREDLKRIQCPTLVMTTEGSALGTVEATREWQQTIPHSELRVIPGDSYHVAATDPERCAEETLQFIRSHSA